MPTPDFSAYTVANAETTSATKFDSFVTAAQTALNNIGDATKTTWAAGQILNPNQLSQGGAATRQGLIWNGSAWAPASLAAITTKTANGISVANTTTETDLFTGTTGSGYLVIPAGSLTSSGGIRITAGGLYTNSSGSSRTIRLKIRLGSSAGLPSFTTFTAAYDSGTSDTISSNALNRAWNLDLQFQALGATNSQAASGFFSMSSATAATTGTGPLVAPSNAALAAPIETATGTVDFSADVGIVLSVIHSAAVASISMTTSQLRIEVSG